MASVGRKTEHYFYLCRENLHKLMRLENKNAVNVFLLMAEKSNFNSGYIFLVVGLRDTIRNELCITDEELDSCVKELVDNRVLFHAIGKDVKTGEEVLFDSLFAINPSYAWHGIYYDKDRHLRKIERLYLTKAYMNIRKRLPEEMEKGWETMLVVDTGSASYQYMEKEYTKDCDEGMTKT